MKNIPIIIQNKDRLDPLKAAVKSLHDRGYYNIIIIDNRSTYPPLLEWYRESGLDVFYNDIPDTKYDTGTFAVLSGKASYAPHISHPKFSELVKDYYVLTDSDVVLVDEVPDNFIEDMIDIHKKYNNSKHKVGLGLKIDDLPMELPLAKRAYEIESQYWLDKIEDPIYDIYYAPIDTTFAVYSPNSVPGLGHDCFRLGGNYMARHIPWYYDVDNLPADEIYYLKHLEAGKGPAYSWQMKSSIDI